MSSETDPVEQRELKLQEIRRLGYDAYPHKFPITHTIGAITATYSHGAAVQLENEPVTVQTAGRLMSIRGHGKAGFADLFGANARIQIYVREDRLGAEKFTLYRLLDVGDFVGVSGRLFRTRTGELTILVQDIEFLAKSLLPLPEKWHGLADVEIRYRQRYLDLIANAASREVFVRRSRIISAMREFLELRGYLEVETPMMQPLSGGAAARPFKTFHEARGIPLYLRIAPELYLKRLVVGGFERVFEINRNFRNEGISTQHNPEFTMLEFYQAYSDYKDLMDLTEELLRDVVLKVTGSLKVVFQGQEINFEEYERYSMVEAILKFWPEVSSRPSVDALYDRSQVVGLLRMLHVEFKPDENWGTLFGLLFEVVAEKHLIRPTFIYNFPVELSPLAKKKDEDPRFVERFEFFAASMELANAYSELNDPEEQRERFEEQLRARQRGDLEAHPMDEDYIRALRYGLPPTAGEGIGIDRLAMLLTDSHSIREVILFPHLRPE
ncbi:MAG: lysine--tRNA ligase [Acidobacteria bacterium]|nr:lysine--tRNA ligase [Acidobacteriota bacterium]